MINVHALRKLGIVLALNLDMHQHPRFDAIAPPNLHELVDAALAQFGVLHDLAQLLVEKGVPTRPIDLGVRHRQEKSHEVHKEGFQRLFPGAIVIVCHWGHSSRLLFLR